MVFTWTSGTAICAGSSTVPQSPILGRSITGSLTCFLHNPSGGAENDFVANSRRLRKDSCDKPTKVGAVAPGFLPHRWVAVSGLGGGVIVMPLTDHSPIGSSFLRHKFGFAGVVTGEDFQSGPSIEIMAVFSVFLVVRMDCFEMEEKKEFRVESSLDQSFVSDAGFFKVGVVSSGGDHSKFSLVPDFGSGRQSSRGLIDLEAIHIGPATCWDAKKSGGVRLFELRDRDGTGDAGMAAGVTSCGLSHFCHKRRRCVGFGLMTGKVRDAHNPWNPAPDTTPAGAVGAHKRPVADFNPGGEAFRLEYREVKARCAKTCLPCLFQSGQFLCERAWICERVAVVPSAFHSPFCGACLQMR